MLNEHFFKYVPIGFFALILEYFLLFPELFLYFSLFLCAVCMIALSNYDDPFCYHPFLYINYYHRTKNFTDFNGATSYPWKWLWQYFERLLNKSTTHFPNICVEDGKNFLFFVSWANFCKIFSTEPWRSVGSGTYWNRLSFFNQVFRLYSWDKIKKT